MFFEKNVKALKERDPVLAESVTRSHPRAHMESIRTKSNVPSLKISNITLHSQYDPVKEAEEWVQYHKKDIDSASSIYVLGFGLGYHLLELCRVTVKEITVIEPRLDILRAAMESVDLVELLSKIMIITDGHITYYKKKSAVLHHRPSVNLEPGYYEQICAKLDSLESMQKSHKILVVGPIYGGSLPIARYCASSLEHIGHDVEFLDNSRFADALFYTKEVTRHSERYNRLGEILSSFLSEVVLARCDENRPDLVFALAQAPLTSDCLEKLRCNKIPTAYWFVEDFRVMEYWKRIAQQYDYFFTIQRGAFLEELRKAGVRNFQYLPVAACPEVHKKMELTEREQDYFGSDIAFVGAGYYNRRHFFKGLIDFDFKIWGNEWPLDSSLSGCLQRSGERVETEDTVKIFNASRISINLHSSTYHKGINPFGDFVNPRTFEIACCGGFQLVDRRSEIGKLFEAGSEIVVFDNLDDLRQKIRFYLNNPEERTGIAERARQRVMKEHTYDQRMNRMLAYLAHDGFAPPVRESEGESIGDLLKEAGEDKELTDYISGFSDRERITLADIREDIESGDGAMSRTEKLFMLMKEFTV